MKNFNKEELALIKSKAQHFYTTIEKSDHWIAHNLDKDQKDSVSIRLKNKKRIIRKIVDSIDSKPVFALFGASQVGKSYLIKNILSVDGAPLNIELGPHNIDFLKDINPPGTGAESTGVVTRFSIENYAPNPDFPIRAKLLNPKDIILILCDSFFSDLKSIDQYPSIQDFHDHGQALNTKYQSADTHQDILVEDDIFDIKDYFEKNFYKFKYYTDNINQSHYWKLIGDVIHKIPREQWHEAFEVFWCRNEELTRLFNTLTAELARIQFAKEVFLEHHTVLRGHGEILDVQRLKELYTSQESCKGLNGHGEQIEIGISIISALSREVSLKCPEALAEKKTFMENTDLLDFPGARSRLEHTIASISDEAIPDMFLRGKVAYLFNKYSSDFEINNLLFCTNDKQLDVNELPSLLNDWIENNIGNNALEREKNISSVAVSPLFVIFTFFNNQLKFDTTNDDKEDISYKWNTRFERFFEQELVTINHDWHTKWTSSNPLFKNFYLLRDYKYSTDTFSGFEDKGTETGIQANRIDFLEKLKTSFVRHPFVQKHFDSPEQAFDEAALPNADGGEKIIQNLLPAATNFGKIKNYSTQLVKMKTNFLHLMDKFHYTDDLDKLRSKAIKESITVQLEMNRIFSQNQEFFNEFLEVFMVREQDLFNYLHDNLKKSVIQEGSTTEYDLFKSGFPELRDEYSAEKNLDIIRASLGLGSSDEVIHILEEQGMTVEGLFPSKRKESPIDTIFNGIIALWSAQIEREMEGKLKAMGFSSTSITILTDAYLKSLEFNEFDDFIKSVIREKYQGFTLEYEAEKYLSAVIAQYFNEFICQFGIHDLLPETFANVQSLQPQLAQFIEAYLNPAPFDENSLGAVFNKMGDENLKAQETNAMVEGYNSYLMKFKIAMLSNCGFVHYDVDQNRILADLLEDSQSLTFEIT